MGSIGRYIFRSTLGAFLMVLVSLTSIIWVTQALREIDLMTSQGQTILVFVGITSLVIPQLVMLIAPIAFLIAVVHLLNKLATDSEIIVMNSAGMSPWRLLRAFAAAALVVSAMVAFVSTYLSPKALRELRSWATAVRADLVTNIVQPGRFIAIEPRLIFHLRERQANGLLRGILLDDRRDPNEEMTFLADRGEIVKDDNGTFLVLLDGSLQRHQSTQRDPTIVNFDRYPFDLSQFSGGATTTSTLAPRELFFWELFSAQPGSPAAALNASELRVEFHDRIVAALYPIAFVVIALGCLAAPRSTRQGRAYATGVAVGAVFLVRLAGFVSLVLGTATPLALGIQYVAIAIAIWVGLRHIGKSSALEAPPMLTEWTAFAGEFFARRAAAFSLR
jgi:lipopolysaccharide export system permease protein